MKTALIELHYLPCIAYFSAISYVDLLIVEKFEHYQKQSFRNRCYIKGPHQIETLIIPVTQKSGRPQITDVKIDYSQKWLNNHWRTIQTGYGKAPFFEYYGPDLYEILFKKHVYLYDLNLALMTLGRRWLGMESALKESTAYERQVLSDATDLRDIINPKKEDGCNRFYKSTEYQQVFGSKFVPNLSIIDLIFNQGPEARSIVKASRPK